MSRCPDCDGAITRTRYCTRCRFRVPQFSRAARQILTSRPHHWLSLLYATLVDDAYSRADKRFQRPRSGLRKMRGTEGRTRKPSGDYGIVGRSLRDCARVLDSIPKVLRRLKTLSPKDVRGVARRSELLASVYERILEWRKSSGDIHLRVPLAAEIEGALDEVADDLKRQFAAIPMRLHAAVGRIERQRPSKNVVLQLIIKVRVPKGLPRLGRAIRRSARLVLRRRAGGEQ
jgi:hypothetical protein